VPPQKQIPTQELCEQVTQSFSNTRFQILNPIATASFFILILLFIIIIITGDFNVIPEDNDAHDIKKYKKDALAQPESRKEFYKYLNLDLLDV